MSGSAEGVDTAEDAFAVSAACPSSRFAAALDAMLLAAGGGRSPHA